MKIINKTKSFNLKEFLTESREVAGFVWTNIIFLAVLFVYVIRGLLECLTKIKFLGKLFLLMKFEVLISWLTKLMYLIDVNDDGGVTRSYLIELAFRNMRFKRNRTIVTVGGVAVGVGAVVFLVSLGYGLEKMVIGRVAKLNELKMADVNLGKALTIKLNDETVNKIKAFENIAEVVPMVSMVAKIKYNNSVFDVMSFGVNDEYVKIINPIFVSGEKFVGKDLNFEYKVESKSSVLGINQEVVSVNDDMMAGAGIFDFNVQEGSKIIVLSECKMGAEALGYAINSEGGYVGEEKWGESYLDKTTNLVGKKKNSEVEYSKWVAAKVPLWLVNDQGGAVPILTKDGQQKWAVGCFKKENLIIRENKESNYSFNNLRQYLEGDVLGEATAAASLMPEEASDSASLFGTTVTKDASGVEWVEMKKVDDDPNKLKEVSFVGEPAAEAFVSTGMLKLLGLTIDSAVGKSFSVSYIIPDGNISGVSGRLQSTETEYKIKGVFEDLNSNYYYFQAADAKRLGINIYSQLKVVAKDKISLAGVRKTIESLGLKTDSTADTVVRIESLFGTLRIILGFLGMIALAVASLGMFNTMTVSLLERTREVGVMKTMGMLSNEVSELFLAESMIMGVGGGIMGILLGYILGRVLSLILSSISIVKGQGAIDIATIPWFLVAFILMVSFLVGIVTGWYPSKRARQISALNALRYE